MHIRKLAAAAGIATGAALTLAPLAQADLGDTVDATKAFEIGSQNSLFETYAALSGDTADITKATTAGTYDSIIPADLDKVAPPLEANVASYGDVTQFETYIYGANPILAGISGDTGPYNEFNGALTEFDNAYNVLAYAAANGGKLDTTVSDYLGSATTVGHAVSGDDATVSSAYQYFLNYGLGDLKGYDAIFSPNATGPGDILPTEANEIVQLNNLFELDGKLANVFADIVPHTAAGTNVGFDTIPVGDLNSTFNDLVFGGAGPSTDPGSYDILNGAVTELYNAINVSDYALLNGGDLLPSDLIFGTHDFTGSVATVVGDYLQLAASDLAGYFDFGSALGSL